MCIIGWFLFFVATIILASDKTEASVPKWAKIDVSLLIIYLFFTGHPKTIVAVTMMISGLLLIVGDLLR